MSDLDFIDSGVAEIAEGMGFESEREEDIAELDTDEQTEETEEPVISDDADEEQPEPLESEPVLKEQPKSWAKDKAELWAKTPDDVKDYIEQREQQMLEGINQYRDGYKWGEWLNKAIEPYREDIEAAGGNEASVIMNLFEHHRAITQGSLEQRQQAFIKIGIASGLIPQEGQAQPDPKVSQLEQRLAAFEREQQTSKQKQAEAAQAKIQQQVEDFAKDKPDFDLLADDITELLQLGHDLETAYEKAKWLNPTARQQEIDRVAKAKLKESQEKLIKDKKATSVNIRPVQSKSKPAEAKGRLFDDDDMMNTLNEIKSRA
jgi:hypothetical protein